MTSKVIPCLLKTSPLPLSWGCQRTKALKSRMTICWRPTASQPVWIRTKSNGHSRAFPVAHKWLLLIRVGTSRF
jgi:hypothetical protein